MKPEEVQTLTENAITSELYGCDCSISNVFLYQEKYKITSHEKHSILFRYYNTTENHTGWAFPIPLKSSSPDYLKTALEEIIKSKKHEFCYISENQKKLIDDTLAANFPEYKVEWQSFRGDSDYLYLQSDLANLPGKPYQKKRNHISRFNRTYENRWEFKMFPKDNIKKDILEVEDKWFAENDGANDPNLQSEYTIIKTAVENAEALNITGAVLYLNNEPSAMCLAAPISDTTLDVLFEKAVGEGAENGSYAAINHLFAKECSAFTYMNREEDLGIEGLRKAKLSWQPKIILDKYYGSMVKNDA